MSAPDGASLIQATFCIHLGRVSLHDMPLKFTEQHGQQAFALTCVKRTKKEQGILHGNQTRQSGFPDWFRPSRKDCLSVGVGGARMRTLFFYCLRLPSFSMQKRRYPLSGLHVRDEMH